MKQTPGTNYSARTKRRYLLSLDPKKLRLLMPGASSDAVLIIAAHKARCEMQDIPEREREESRKWLEARGLKRVYDMEF